jgi:hypothetical protein
VEREYEECLCTERIDSFVVALLPYAMIENLNIHSDGYVSEKLLYQLKTILLPSLSTNIAEFHFIDIDAKRDGKVLESKNAVGTALSCGVDSFYTVLKHLDADLEGFRLTHLTYFNIMNSNLWQGREDSSRDFSNARIEYVRPAVEELGLKLVTVDSNFDTFYSGLGLLATISFRYFGTVLALQKLFGNYYWSSTYSLSQFDFSIEDIEIFDLLSVQCISTENTTVYCAGAEVTRLEKTAYISDFAVTYKFLNVCWFHLYNCSKCDKCKGTMLGLYALGKLDRYDKVFDVNYFYQNRDEYLGYMLFKRIGAKHRCLYVQAHYLDDVYQYLLERDIKIPIAAKLYALKLVCSAIKRRVREL